MKKSLILSVFIALTMMLGLADSNMISAQQTVEDQYWEAVKNSTNADDFKNYLKEYPNGKYAAIARGRIGGNSTASNDSSTSFLSFKTANAMTNGSFMERLENHISPQLPLRFGEYEIYRADAPASVENYFYIYVRTINSDPPNSLSRQASPLKARLLSDYCGSEIAERKITLVLGWDKINFSEHLRPSDCGAGAINSANQTDAEYLNNWAAEVRIGLPEMVGAFQLVDAWSRCPDGCQEKDRPTYLLLLFNALDSQKNVPIAQLERSLAPVLLEEYCNSDAIKRNISLGVFFSNRGAQADYNNFWVEPAACSAKNGGY